jgi:hypothetical protein
MMTLSDSLTQGSKRLRTLSVIVGMMRVFAFLALAAADAPARETLAEMAAAIAAGEHANNFFTGDDNVDIANTPRSRLMHGCVKDKLSALGEGPMMFQNDFQVDIAACCVPYRPKPNKPELVPECVPALEAAYKIVREAKSDNDMNKAAPIFKSYMKQLGDGDEL